MYRTQPEAGPACDLHPAAPARATCASCAARICVPCTLHDGLSTVCPPCAKKTRRRARARWVGTRAALAIVIGGAYLATAHAIKQRREHPLLWGEDTPKVRLLIDAHHAQPCDSVHLMRLARKLGDLGDVYGGLEYLDRARTSCELLTDEVDKLAFDLHRRAHDQAGALQDLDRRIGRDPKNAERLIDRAHHDLTMGEPQAAIGDYVAALRCPNAEKRRVLSELRQVYEQLGHQAVATALSHAMMYAQIACDLRPLGNPDEPEAKLFSRSEAKVKMTEELQRTLPPELAELKLGTFVDSLCDTRSASNR